MNQGKSSSGATLPVSRDTTETVISVITYSQVTKTGLGVNLGQSNSKLRACTSEKIEKIALIIFRNIRPTNLDF